MTNYLHPKDLAPMLVDQSLDYYYNNDILFSKDTHTMALGFRTKEIISKAVNGYRYRKGFSDTCKGIVYRIVQFVKAIFGRSDWNKALNALSKEYFYHADVYLDGAEVVSTKYALNAALGEKLISSREFDKHMSTYNKYKKCGLNYFFRSLINLTKEQVAEPSSGVAVDLEGMIKTIDLMGIPTSKGLSNELSQLNKVLNNPQVLQTMRSIKGS